jgi:hypothetical protein
LSQYNVVIDPGRMRSLGIPLSKVREVIRQNNMDVGGRTVELAEHEFMVRGRGYIKNVADLERIVVKVDGGTPVLLKDIARVELGPDERRGIAELNGEGEVASGIALQRFGQRPQCDHQHQGRAWPSISAGSRWCGVRPLQSTAPSTAAPTLSRKARVALVCIVFSPKVAIIMLPVGVMSLTKMLGVQHHELGRHCHRHRYDRRGHRRDRERAQAFRARPASHTAGDPGGGGKQVGRRCFSLLIITVSFCRYPLEAGGGRSGRYTKRSPWRRRPCCRSRWCPR